MRCTAAVQKEKRKIQDKTQQKKKYCVQYQMPITCSYEVCLVKIDDEMNIM